VGKLEDKTIDEITAADLDDLLGREENQRLELKEAIDGIDTYELAKDLSSMANADGGYFIVGAVQDKKTERCTGFKSISNADPIFKKIKDVAAGHIQERLAVEPVLRETGKGEGLVLAPIPKSKHLRAVINNGQAQYWRRVGRDKRPMTHSEIMAAASASRLADEENRKLQEKLAKDQNRWSEITDPNTLREQMDGRFENEIGAERYLRLTSTPHALREDRVNVADETLRNFVWYPVDPSAGQHDKGFHLYLTAGQCPLITTNLGLESQCTMREQSQVLRICLTRSGHFELWVPLFPWICFQQAISDFRERPWMWPLAVVEFPVSFMRFTKALNKRLGIDSKRIVSMQYRNLAGCLLPPGMGQGLSFIRSASVYRSQHFDPYDFQISPEFDPDGVALRFVQRLYRAFGYQESNVPYFVDGRFRP
jgi:hypothetical protein